MALIESVHTPAFIFSQGLLQELGFAPATIGIYLGVSYGLTALVLIVIDRVPLFSLTKLSMITIICLIILIAVVGSIKTPVIVLIGLGFINVLPQLLFVFTDAFFQNSSESSFRASFLSVQSLLSSVFISIANLGLGYASTQLGLQQAFFCLLIPLVLAAILFSLRSFNLEASP